MEVVKIAQCLLTINIQRIICTVIKLHVLKEAIQSSSSLPFITSFNLFLHGKTFQGRNPILLLSIQSGVRLIEVFNNRNLPNTTITLSYFSVRVRLMEVSDGWGFVTKGK